MKRLDWPDFKAIATARGLSIQELNLAASGRYWLALYDGPFALDCELDKKEQATETADYEANFRPASNRRLQTANNAGYPVIETSIRRGVPGTRAMSIVTHDFGDRTSWYQKSLQVTDEILTTTDTLTFASANPWWINFDSLTSKLTHQYKGVTLREPTVARPYGNHPDWTVVVKVNDIVVTTGFTINYAAGTITFASAQAGIVKATYWHNNGVSMPSEFLIVPPPGKKYTIEHVELQFSKTTIMSTIRFEIWAYPAGATSVTLADGKPGKQVNPAAYIHPQAGPFPTALFDAGMGQLRADYRNVRDLINAANEGKGAIPPVEGIASDTLIFPFNYVQAFTLDSAMNTLFRMRILNDTAFMNSDVTTATFYLIMEPS